MFQFRAMNLFAVGAGYLFVATVDRWRPKNTFTVKAQMLQIPKLPKKDVPFSELTRYGMPQRDVEIRYPNIKVSYDNKNRTPNWVLEHLTYDNAKNFKVKYLSFIEADMSVTAKFRASIQDYKTHDQFTMLRLAAKNNHRYLHANYDATAKLSNVAPQNSQMCCFWADLESFVRYLTHTYKDLFVITGPLILSDDCTKQVEYEVFGQSQIPVPNYFFKIVIGRNIKDEVMTYDAACWLVPNTGIDSKKSLGDYRIELFDLEKKLGFKMFKDPMVIASFGSIQDARDFRRKKDQYMNSIGLEHLDYVP